MSELTQDDLLKIQDLYFGENKEKYNVKTYAHESRIIDIRCSEYCHTIIIN